MATASLVMSADAGDSLSQMAVSLCWNTELGEDSVLSYLSHTMPLFIDVDGYFFFRSSAILRRSRPISPDSLILKSRNPRCQ